MELATSTREGSEVIEGELRCRQCARGWPVRGGVPRFVERSSRTARAFGWEWHAFHRLDPHHERQFLDWVAPLERGSFEGRVVLEGGCGKGRHTRLVSRYGARAVIAVDLSDAVDVAFRNAGREANAHIIQADLLSLPLRPESCDVAFSVGVLHHLSDPLPGFRSLARVVRPGGTVSVWVYGAEGNEWIARWVSPARAAVTSRLPPQVLYAFSMAAAAPLWLATRCLYRPARRDRLRWLRSWLIYYSYMSYIADFPFREIHHIVHDHLAAPVAHYLSRAEVAAWFNAVGASSAVIERHNENSWRGCGRMPESEARHGAFGGVRG